MALTLALASLGARLGAQIIDLVLTTLALAAWVWGLLYLLGWSSALASALIALGILMTRTPYYVVTELAWNGRTLAKRWLGLRTVSRDGGALTARQVVVRNLLREVEVFLPTVLLIAPGVTWYERIGALAWFVVCWTVALRSRHRQRLGDMVADTVVVEDPRPRLRPDLARAPRAVDRAQRFAFAPGQLDHYGSHELTVLERLLRARPAGGGERRAGQSHARTLKDASARIAARIGWSEPLGPDDHEPFLEAFYRAQRDHLEGRALMGEARADKGWRDQGARSS